MAKVEILLRPAVDSLVLEEPVVVWAALEARVVQEAPARMKRPVVMARLDRAAHVDVSSLPTNIQVKRDCCYFGRGRRRSEGHAVKNSF